MDETRGTFQGISVQTGAGGGLATGGELVADASTHFHAARLPELGDTVLAVTRTFDTRTAAALAIELRAFAAAAPGRGALATMDEQSLLASPGAIAFARVELSRPGFAADERRPAQLARCVVSDAAPTAAAARGVADWLRRTWETELAFGSWPAVRGALEAFASDGGAPADWALEWLRATEHLVTDDTNGSFVKVLSAAWLEPTASEQGAAG